jgi:hypothetical protein
MVVRQVHLRDGTIEVAEIEPSRWRVTWAPFRDDHPDAPTRVIDSANEPIPATDTEGVIAWAEARFGGRDTRDVAVVTIEEEADDAQARSIQQLFDQAGAPAVVSARMARRSAGELPWLVMIEVPLTAFVTALAAAAGTDAWKALKSFVGHLFEHRSEATGRSGSIQLEGGNRTVILSPEVSDDGFQQVTEGSLPEGGYYVWDSETQSWLKF